MGDRGGARSRVFARREGVLAAALFALLVLAYLCPVLLGGKMLSPLSSLYGSVPWRGLAPADVGDYLNPLLSDIPTADYPWRALARELIREGTFPAWNPHVFAGIPFFANPQTMVLSPFSVPLWVLPLHDAAPSPHRASHSRRYADARVVSRRRSQSCAAAAPHDHLGSAEASPARAPAHGYAGVGGPSAPSRSVPGLAPRVPLLVRVRQPQPRCAQPLGELVATDIRAS